MRWIAWRECGDPRTARACGDLDPTTAWARKSSDVDAAEDKVSRYVTLNERV